MKKTAIIGASGFIGSHLLAEYRRKYPDCIGTAYSQGKHGLVEFDLRKPDINALSLEETGHEAVIVASAMPLIGKCEAHPKDTYELNVAGPLKLAEQLARKGIHIYFLSSDYVFDGKSGAYTDQSPACPVTEYGRQKAEVEKELPNITGDYTVLRLSKIYGTSWQDGTLIDDMASQLVQGKQQKVATDQFFSPTHVEDVVKMTIHAQEVQAKGVLNVCHSNKYSRDLIARKLIAALDLPESLLESISLHDVPGMENRPLDTSIICSSIFDKLQAELWSMERSIKMIAENWAYAAYDKRIAN